MTRSFVKLTSNCDFFKLTNNVQTNSVDLIWDVALPLHTVKSIGLYELKIRYPENGMTMDENIETTIHCNLLERTLTNPNKEIACVHWSKSYAESIILENNLGLLITFILW